MMKHISAFLLTAVMAAPTVVLAAPSAQDRRSAQERRVYDRAHKDYHVWDDREDRAYHAWLAEQHHRNQAYSRLKQKEQREYWSWRHDHGDGDRR
jgi:uncharacterized protein YecT (DUF1311 family)